MINEEIRRSGRNPLLIWDNSYITTNFDMRNGSVKIIIYRCDRYASDSIIWWLRKAPLTFIK